MLTYEEIGESLIVPSVEDNTEAELDVFREAQAINSWYVETVAPNYWSE